MLVHVVTQKGRGYRFAEEDPAKFHGIGKFDPATGKKLGDKVKTYSGMKMTPAEYMAAVEQVGLSDVVACANSLCLHSTYFLKGADQ